MSKEYNILKIYFYGLSKFIMVGRPNNLGTYNNWKILVRFYNKIILLAKLIGNFLV